jgi:hypothetical protein
MCLLPRPIILASLFSRSCQIATLRRCCDLDRLWLAVTILLLVSDRVVEAIKPDIVSFQSLSIYVEQFLPEVFSISSLQIPAQKIDDHSTWTKVNPIHVAATLTLRSA